MTSQLISHGIEIVPTTHIQSLGPLESEYFTVIERNTPPLGANRIEYLAGRFAAKQAILKALQLEINPPISWLDIEIQRLPSGQPSVLLHRQYQTIAAQLQITQWLLSISHTPSYAAASAIALRTSANQHP